MGVGLGDGPFKGARASSSKGKKPMNIGASKGTASGLNGRGKEPMHYGPSSVKMGGVTHRA